MNVIVLAGGYGSRLKGIWDKPKCLVPVHGKTLLEHLLRKLAVIKPAEIVLSLGYKSEDVILKLQAVETAIDPIYTIEEVSKGTCTAVQYSVMLSGVDAPLLIINGDTLPLYSFRELQDHYLLGTSELATIVVDKFKGIYAGAMILSTLGLRRLMDCKLRDLDDVVYPWILSQPLYFVNGFIDVGTPEGLRTAQNIDEKVLYDTD